MTVYTQLLFLGFKFRRVNKKQAILKSQRMRNEYLKENMGKHIIYLNESWDDTHDVIKRGSSDESLNIP